MGIQWHGVLAWGIRRTGFRLPSPRAVGRAAVSSKLLGNLKAADRVSRWEMPSISADSFLLLFGQALILGQGAR